MPVQFSVKADIDALRKQLDHWQKQQLPFAIALALTRTAQAIVPIEQRAMQTVFDRPTPFTLKSLRVVPATKQKQVAEVRFKDLNASQSGGEEHYLWPQIDGGARVAKRFEILFRQAGILPDGMFIVPGAGAKLDAYGNMSRGQLIQILSQLRIQAFGGFESRIGGARFDAKKVARAVKRQGYRIFAVREKVGKLIPGVYARFDFAVGSAVKPLLIFIRQPQYRARFKFFDIAQQAAERIFPGEFERALVKANSTAIFDITQ